MDVPVQQELFNEVVGRLQIKNLFAGKESGKAILPGEVIPFDFAFGLRGRCISKGHAIKVQCLSQLRVLLLGEKDGVVIDVELKGQP